MSIQNGEYNLAEAPEDYPGETYHHGYAPEHHVVWWKNTGEIPDENEVIHHINGEKTDNRFENLEKLKRSKHSLKHIDEKKKIAVLRCPNCKEIFERRFGKTYLSDPNRNEPTACSKSCALKFYHSDTERFPNVLHTYIGSEIKLE